MLSKIAFIHIRKTAGSSLLDALASSYPPEQRLLLDGRARKLEKTRQLLAEYRNRPISFLHGHVGFGVTKYLSADFLRVTILRDPLERVVSQYFFLRQRNLSANAYYQKHGLQYVLADPEVNHLFANVQTRVLCSDDLQICEKPASEMDGNDLATALRNLESLALVGFTEDFDRLLADFAAKFGANTRTVEPRNVNPAKPSLRDLPASTRRLLAQANELDQELMQWHVETCAGGLAVKF